MKTLAFRPDSNQVKDILKPTQCFLEQHKKYDQSLNPVALNYFLSGILQNGLLLSFL